MACSRPPEPKTKTLTISPQNKKLTGHEIAVLLIIVTHRKLKNEGYSYPSYNLSEDVILTLTPQKEVLCILTRLSPPAPNTLHAHRIYFSSFL